MTPTTEELFQGIVATLDGTARQSAIANNQGVAAKYLLAAVIADIARADPNSSCAGLIGEPDRAETEARNACREEASDEAKDDVAQRVRTILEKAEAIMHHPVPPVP